MLRGRGDHLRVSVRLAVAAVVGVVAGLLIPIPAGETTAAHLLVGFMALGVAFCVPLLWVVMRIDARATHTFVDGLDPTRTAVDAALVVASIASLAGVGYMLIGSDGGNKVFEAILTVVTVSVGWLLIHTTYTVRYARHWYNAQPGCVDFEGQGAKEPQFSDFAYLSFTLGMTYQVSDTDLKTAEIRKIVLQHTLLSYLFGTVIVAATINLVAGLAK